MVWRLVFPELFLSNYSSYIRINWSQSQFAAKSIDPYLAIYRFGAQKLQWRHMNVMVSQITGNTTTTCWEANNNENTKAPHYLPFVRESHRYPVVPLTRANSAKKFSCHDVIIIWWMDASDHAFSPFDSNITISLTIAHEIFRQCFAACC